MQYEHDYLKMMGTLLNEPFREDRTGVGTYSRFGQDSISFNTLPLLTTKKVWWKGIVEELLWFLRGSSDISELQRVGVHIWDEWTLPGTTSIGKGYGYQWRHNPDQLVNLICGLRENPTSRRHIVSLWDPNDAPHCALPPCHGLVIQFYVRNSYLDCQVYQRSADVFLGVPFNMVSYWLLTDIIGACAGLQPGRVRIVFGDLHLYKNHVPQALEQLSRDPMEQPKGGVNLKLMLSLMKSTQPWRLIEEMEADDLPLTRYEHHPAISAPVAI